MRSLVNLTAMRIACANKAVSHEENTPTVGTDVLLVPLNAGSHDGNRYFVPCASAADPQQ